MNHENRLLASALDQLSPAEEAALQYDLEHDVALRREWQELHETLNALLDDLELESVIVPVDAEDRLIARLRAENLSAGESGASQDSAATVMPAPTAVTAPTSSPTADPAAVNHSGGPIRRPVWWLALPLGLAAAVALLFAVRPPADPLSRYAGTPGAISTPVMAGGQALGTVVRLPDGRVYVHLSRPAGAGQTYQLWQIQAGVPVSLGVFDEAGLLTAALPPGATVAVSVEPPGGSPQPTTAPLFAQSV